MLIAIEGIDGSGKGTQTRLLQQRLVAEGRTAALLSFPRYADTLFGGLIGGYLNGRLGTLDQVHPLLAALLFAGDRFESRDVLQAACEAHDVVILDRYVASNIAHQGARAAALVGRLEKPSYGEDELTALIEQIEYGIFGLPRADLTILLDIPAESAAELIARKKPRDYTEQAADLHEADLGYLDSVRQMYRRLAEGKPDWRIIPVVDSGEVRPIAEIAEDIHAACSSGLRRL
jgi:dTMP kinase